MGYDVAVIGLGRVGISDSSPHWYCTCGEWRFNAKPNPRAATGNNLAAAQRAHGVHVTRVVPSR